MKGEEVIGGLLLAWTLVSPERPMSLASPALLTADATNLQPRTMWETRMVGLHV
jgi:hypothetical protein